MLSGRKRPAECRLCQCPVVDTGVPMDQLDAEKLSEWWKQKLDVKLDLQSIAQQRICQFCLWDARLEHEQHLLETPEVDQNADCDWWNGFDNNPLFFNNYYKDAAIQQCSVRTENHRSDKRTHECIYCGIPVEDLRLHMLKVHAKVINLCRFEHCKKVFDSKSDRNKHYRREHKKLLRCIYCDNFVSFHNGYLKNHINKFHSKNVILCHFGAYCGGYFKSEAEKLAHIELKHKSFADEIECEVCKVTVLRPHINSHMREFHHRSNHPKGSIETCCCYCQKQFPTKSSAWKHVKDVHSNIETFSCYSCEIFFETVELKREHYQKKHRGEFKCIVCADWKCTLISNLSRHYRNKHKGNYFRCNYNNMCVLYFKNEKDLQIHIKKCHETDTSDKERCVYCKKLIQRYYLKQHIEIHHKLVAIMKCNFLKKCLSYFLNEKDRQKHIQEVHQPSAPSLGRMCPICQQTFRTKIDLKRHAARYHNKAIKMCRFNHCKFICTNLETLELHVQKLHSNSNGLIQLQCPKCDYTSDTLKVLRCHDLLVHGREKLKCEHCPQLVFHSKLLIKAHIRYHHALHFTCKHCKNQILSASWKRHLVKLRCEHCDSTCYCTISHANHIRECLRKKFNCD